MELTSHPPVMTRAFLPDSVKNGSGCFFLLRRKVDGAFLLVAWRIVSFSLETERTEKRSDGAVTQNTEENFTLRLATGSFVSTGATKRPYSYRRGNR